MHRCDVMCHGLPPGGFDPPTSRLWVLRSASELRGFKGCSSALMHRCDVMWYIPATRFDRVTSELWAPRAASAPCRFKGCSSALMHRCDVMGYIPATRFDRVTSGLWALRASSAPCRFIWTENYSDSSQDWNLSSRVCRTGVISIALYAIRTIYEWWKCYFHILT